MRKKPWAESELADNEFVLRDAALHKGQWSGVFQNANPIHIEIGMGKGDFILEKASGDPSVNFIGFDKQMSVLAVAARKIRERGDVRNIRVMLEDGGSLTEMFAENEVGRIYINFCDPWPKKRYEKRRLTHSSFLAKYGIVLKNGGKLFFKTDNSELYKYSIDELLKNNWRIETQEINPVNSNVLTEYERRFTEQGMKIYMMAASLKY